MKGTRAKYKYVQKILRAEFFTTFLMVRQGTLRHPNSENKGTGRLHIYRCSDAADRTRSFRPYF